MIKLKTKNNIPVNVPDNESEDPSPKFNLDQKTDIKEYYDKNGYVVLSKVINFELCDKARISWNDEIKFSNEYIYRQANGKPERNILNKNDWVMNPILNMQSLNEQKFPHFRKACIEILTNAKLNRVAELILGEKPKIVQSMFFEGNSETWEHQDTYYLDASKVGSMCGSWIALEDIKSDAGRFFICPQSHLLNVEHNPNNNIANAHEKYISSIVNLIIEKKYFIRAPFLEKGDVIFWNSKTIHGSLASQSEKNSRSSITCHSIPQSEKLLQYQKYIKPMDIIEINGIKINCPKNMNKLKNKIIMKLEMQFPNLYSKIRSFAINRKFI